MFQNEHNYSSENQLQMLTRQCGLLASCLWLWVWTYSIVFSLVVRKNSNRLVPRMNVNEYFLF
jgi:hypothetical protein